MQGATSQEKAGIFSFTAFFFFFLLLLTSHMVLRYILFSFRGYQAQSSQNVSASLPACSVISTTAALLSFQPDQATARLQQPAA